MPIKNWMNKSHVLALRALVAVINVIVASLVVTSLYPVVIGAFQVKLPEEKDVSWELDKENLILKTNFTIQNGGFYDITDVQITVHLSNRTGTPLLDHSFVIETIPSMSNTVQPVEVPMDLRRLVREDLEYLAFEDDLLRMRADVVGKYTLGLVEFSASCDIYKNWTALIGNITVDEANVTASYYGTLATLRVPYEVTTAGWLTGAVTVLVSLYNGTDDFITTNATTIVLGGKQKGCVNFDLTEPDTEDLLQKSQRLRITIEVRMPNVENLTFERIFYYAWGAPLDGFSAGTPSVSWMNVTVPFNFTNNSPRALDLTLSANVYHNATFVVGQGTTTAYVPSGNAHSGSITIHLTSPETPTYYSLTAVDENSGLVYRATEVIA